MLPEYKNLNWATPIRWFWRIFMPVCILAALAIWGDAAIVQMVYEYRTVATHYLAINISKLANPQFYAIPALGIYVASLIALSISFLQPWKLLLERLVRQSLLMLLALLTGGLVTFALKHIVARGRPTLLLESEFYGISMSFTGAPFNSFPSSHAFTAFGVAFALANIMPVWRVPLLLAASMVGMSRVIALEHFLSDVVASAFIAAWCVNIWSARIRQSNWALRQPWRWYRG
nr:phosphatase PAP2 family protein [Halomonas olivaria]